MKIEVVRRTPRPVLMVTCPASLDARRDAANEVFNKLLEMGVIAVACRGVELDRLPLILANGCDVLPTNSPIFADYIDKAIEYGGVAQVIQVFDHERLKRTFAEVSAGADPSEIQRLKETYMSSETSVGGNKIWFSMLSFEDGRRTTPYEVAYGSFIPDDPWDALIALAIFVETDQERDTALGLLENWHDPT